MPLRKLLGLKKSRRGEQSNPPSQCQGPQPHQHQNYTHHQPYQYPNYRQPVSAVPLASPQQGYQFNQQALIRFPGPKLCQVCNNLNFADIIRPGGVAQHTSLSALRAAAAWGYVLCNILHHGLLRSDYNKIRLTQGTFSDKDPGFHFRIFKHAKYDCMGVRAGPFSPQQFHDVEALQKWLETYVKSQEQPFWVSAENTEVKLWENRGDPATALLSDVSPLKPKPKKPWSDEYIAEIKTALDTCISSHVVCPSFGEDDEPQLPNRVLYVGTLQAPEICFFEPHTYPNGRRTYYAALSYCWGPSQNLRLLKTTLEAFKNRITEDMLPRTILEAVFIARRLGLLFLWVDALCIIQDSTDDWKAESMLMASIYHNAWVTIGVGIASSVHEGVIVSYPPALELELAQLPSFDPNGTRTATAFIGLEPDKEFVPVKLRTQGWCFQEELLSPRFLLFDDENWELCCQNRKVENRHDQSRLAHAFFGTHDPDEEHWEAFRQVEHNIHHNWRALMERYSLRSLTVASDKLVAISGLAKRFQAVTHDTYVAGGWAKSIAHDIMWEMQQAPVREDDPRKGEAKFLAPSWSWVSVDAGVIWPYNNEMEDSDIVVTNISLSLTYENLSTSEYDPFGPLLDGHVNM